MSTDLLELESELTTEDRLRRWGRRVRAAMLGQECPECVSRGLRIEELRGQLKEAGEKYTRLQDLKEAEPVPKVTDADLAAAFGTLLPEQEPRYALEPRVADLRALKDAPRVPASDTTSGGPWQRAEPMHRSSGSTSPPPALYRPPTALEAARRRHRVSAILAHRAPTNQEIAARATGGEVPNADA
jgi:hypothetical protein